MKWFRRDKDFNTVEDRLNAPDAFYDEWERTPWLLRKLGKSGWRRRRWEGWIPEPMGWDYDDGTRILAR